MSYKVTIIGEDGFPRQMWTGGRLSHDMMKAARSMEGDDKAIEVFNTETSETTVYTQEQADAFEKCYNCGAVSHEHPIPAASSEVGETFCSGLCEQDSMDSIRS